MTASTTLQAQAAHATDAIVEAIGLSKDYDQQRVVNGIDFRIPRGRCFGFLGPNGAGKTTTLRMLLGLTPVTQGKLSMFGLDVQQHSAQIRARVGVVPQTDNLDPDFSVAENLRMYARYFGLRGPAIEARIGQLLEFISLDKRRQALTETLSGGMKRRLTIARALINDPELVILDEPTTGLDPSARHLIWGRLSELRQRGVTLILTTHYMEEAERLCDELVIMDHGEILDQGSPSQLISRHVEPEVVEIRSGGLEIQDTLKSLPDCRIESMGMSMYCYTRDSGSLLSCLREQQGLTFLHRPAGLEDVFLKLTGRELRD